jgi:exosortase
LNNLSINLHAPPNQVAEKDSAAQSIRANNDFGEWIRSNPSSALLLLTVLGTLVYFFGFLPLFVKGVFTSGVSSTAAWAWQAWNPTANQEHSKLVPLISLALIWYHRKKIKNAEKRGSNSGLLFVAIGIALFLLSARCLQPRFALASIPFLIYGSVLYLWGKQVARIVLFPCAFLIFMVPVAAIEQATFRLQFIITGIVGFLSNLVGIKIQALGTTLTAADGSFNFEIAEGCSGIRSLTAMTMITAVYVHLTQNNLLKKILILAFSIVFAIAGNVGRIFTVVLVARFIDPKLASGIYHEYSGFVFFPIALIAMLLFSKLINLHWGQPQAAPRQLEHEQLKT